MHSLRTRCVVLAVSAALGACATTTTEDVASSEGNLGTGTFDKNNLVDDATLTDFAPAAADTAKVQAFLEKTPFTWGIFWSTTSALATYRENGKLASEILTTVAKKHRINPIELLVAVEAEQSLISETGLDEDRIKLAFRCGCPDGDECRTNPERFIGFTLQAECYAGTLRESLDAQRDGKPTKAGWKRGLSRLTNDQPKVLVTPANMATAALYSYTPVVGKNGGGDPALGGMSNHWEIAQQFTKALGYTGPVRTASDDAGANAEACTTSAECDGRRPVCDKTVGRCVACAGDFGTANPRACDSADLPACKADGACVTCSATNASACGASTSTPACVPDKATCGCTTDAVCGAGKLCDRDLGPAGLCVAGCKVTGGVDSCGATARCSARDGKKGTCGPITCATDGCPNGLVCDASATCVECTTTKKDACTTGGKGAACFEGRCGCTVDRDCGSGRSCDVEAHTCRTTTTTDAPRDTSPPEAKDAGAPVLDPPAQTLSDTAQPPSGHSDTDRDAPTKPAPTFTPQNRSADAAGCGVSPGGSSPSPLFAFGAGLLFLLAGRRRRQS